MTEPHDRVIRASEIGQYAYCAHAWWLGSIEGAPSAHQEALEAGEAAHRRHGAGVQSTLWLKRLAYTVLMMALVSGLMWLLGL